MCTAQGMCMGVSVACTADTCPSGSVCCASGGGGRGGTSTQCMSGDSCGMGGTQLCSMMSPCPTGERCAMFGGGGTSICVPERDAGGFPGFDAGFPTRDASRD